MKQRRRLEITTFRRRTTVVLRKGAPSEVLPPPPECPTSNVQCPKSPMESEVSIPTCRDSDRVSASVQGPTSNVQSHHEE
jgi:hypothetical protein